MQPRGVHLNLSRITFLPKFGEVNTMGNSSKEEDQAKMKYLIIIMTALIRQPMSHGYDFVGEGDGNHSDSSSRPS